MVNYIDHYKSPLGDITISTDGESIRGLWFDGQKYDRLSLSGQIIENGNFPIFDETKKWLDIYFEGNEPDFSLPIKIGGSEFQKLVGEIMQAIPYGKVVTYGQIAKTVAEKLGKQSMSAQAVGGAVGHNQISIIVPCHRVVGANGNLTGYAGGLWRKKALLELENVRL